MPRSAVLTQHIRDERQEQIMRAALGVFARQGLAATKISDIAAAAHVSHGLVHHYFGNKDDMFTAVVERALQGGLQLARSGLDGTGTPWERLQMVCAAMVDGIVSEPEYVLLVVQVSVDETAPSQARRLLDDYSAQTLQQLAALIQQGQQAGQVVAGDPVLLAETFTACIQGLGITRVLRPATGQLRRPDPGLILRLLQA